MNESKAQNNQRKVKSSLMNKTEQLAKEEKDAKHRMFVLYYWLKTYITYNEDIKASMVLIRPKMLYYKLIDYQKANRLFPYFDYMLKISDAMSETISVYKTQNINEVMIGNKLNKIVSYYKIYLEYFKHKSYIKAVYEDLYKLWPKELRNIETYLRAYFDNVYRQRAVLQSKLSSGKSSDSSEKPFNNPKSNITIHDCLERPLYRLFKYHLLIDSYLKKLSPKHPDYEPLKRTKYLFVEIGEKCNNSFTEQERYDLKFKLETLYGRSLPQNSHYKTMMTAYTLYFPCKLYIFSNLIIVSKAEKMIGFRQYKLYMNLGIDEFSFISYKKDMKYFKSILMLCGIYDCIHFFLPDKGTRLEIYQLVSKMIQEQKMKAFQKRQHKEAKQGNKLTFLLDEKESQATSWLTGIKLYVVDIDMRYLGVFTNDTVFIVSVWIPEYIDDEATFLKTSNILLPYQQSKPSQISKTSSKNYLPPQSNRDSMTKYEYVITSKMGPVQYKKLYTESYFVKISNYSTINQHLYINLSSLIEIYKDLKERFPEINFPEIDPLSKDFNFYTESKKKTKTFYVRSFLIEEFFNFVFRYFLYDSFRHPSIMYNPLSVLSKLKIDEYLWDYVVARSFYIQNDRRDDHLGFSQTAGNKYDHNHCKLCKESVIDSIQRFEVLREKMVSLQTRKIENYCFNFYNLLRNSLLAFSPSEFNTVERMLLYAQYFEGRLDYAFLYKKNLAKVSKVIKVNIPKLVLPYNRDITYNSSVFHTQLYISVDHKTTVGMVIGSISRDTEIINMFDYRLVIVFNGQYRILGQDEYLYELIEKYQLPSEYKKIGESELYFVGPRNSYKEPSIIKSTTKGMFSIIKNWLPINKNESYLCLRKMIYFPLYLEIESITKNFNRSELIIAYILNKVSKTPNASSIPLEVWGEMCGLYYCLLNCRYLVSIRASITTDQQSIAKCCGEIIPYENSSFLKSDAFIKKTQSTINERKKYIINLNNQTEITFKSSINLKIIELAYKFFKVNHTYVSVEAKRVPNSLVLDSGLVLNGDCIIGVNHSELIVLRDRKASTYTVRIPLYDVYIVHSVYSLFLSYRRENRQSAITENSSENKVEYFYLRFDSKMLHGFAQLCEKYKLLKNKFGVVFDAYENISN